MIQQDADIGLPLRDQARWRAFDGSAERPGDGCEDCVDLQRRTQAQHWQAQAVSRIMGASAVPSVWI